MGRKISFDYEEKDESWMSQIIAWWNKNPHHLHGLEGQHIVTPVVGDYKQHATQSNGIDDYEAPLCEALSSLQNEGIDPQWPFAISTNFDLGADSNPGSAFTVGGVIVGGSSSSHVPLHTDFPSSIAIGCESPEGHVEFNPALHHHQSNLTVDRDCHLSTNPNFKTSGSGSGLSKEVCEIDID
jgi:hypothetical protein